MMTPQERSEMNTEARMRRLDGIKNQMKYAGPTLRADAQRPREAPPNISTSPSRHLEDSRGPLLARLICLSIWKPGIATYTPRWRACSVRW